MAAWPPNIDALKLDMKIALVDLTPTQEQELQQTLDAAVAYVQRVRSDLDFTLEGFDAPDDLVLGTLRYARRLDLRRESPVGMVVVDGITSATIPGWDTDTEKLLQVGRYGRIRFA